MVLYLKYNLNVNEGRKMKEKKMDHQRNETPDSSSVNRARVDIDVDEQEYLDRVSNFGEGYYDASSYFNFDEESGKS